MQVIRWEIECLCWSLAEKHLNKPGKYLLMSFSSTIMSAQAVLFGTVDSQFAPPPQFNGCGMEQETYSTESLFPLEQELFSSVTCATYFEIFRQNTSCKSHMILLNVVYYGFIEKTLHRKKPLPYSSANGLGPQRNKDSKKPPYFLNTSGIF